MQLVRIVFPILLVFLSSLVFAADASFVRQSTAPGTAALNIDLTPVDACTAGTDCNRFVFGFFGEEQNVDGQQLTGVSLNGQAGTFINHITETVAQPSHLEVWCWD